MNEVLRVEALNFNKSFDLIKICFTYSEAQRVMKENDDYYVRVVDCKNNRRILYSNFDKVNWEF